MIRAIRAITVKLDVGVLFDWNNPARSSVPPLMAPLGSVESRAQAISRARKAVVALAMFGTAAVIAKEAAPGPYWDGLLFAGMTAAAGIGLTRRSVVAQILSRALSALILLPTMIAALFALVQGRHLPLDALAVMVATGAALVLSWPMLHTIEARKTFDPKAFRHWFLAGATTTAATGIATGAVAFEAGIGHGHHVGILLSFGALSLSLLASAVGVVRMRGWGIVLGALTSFVLLAVAPFMRGDVAFALMLAASPGLLLQLLPVLVARASGDAPAGVRVAEAALPYAQVRVATSGGAVTSDFGAQSELDADHHDARRAAMRV